MTEDRNLLRWYRRFNGLYFGSRLPPDIIIGYSRALKDCEGDCWFNGERFRIRLNPKLCWSWSAVLITLIHEMAHVKLWDKHNGHGPVFRREIKRLESIGAFRKLL